jgi:hypothetical protein
MAEIAAGASTVEAVGGAPLDDPSLSLGPVPATNDPPWLYSVETQTVDVPGLLMVRVTVAQDLPPERQPATFTLTRLLQDPTLVLVDATQPAIDPATGAPIQATTP